MAYVNVGPGYYSLLPCLPVGSRPVVWSPPHRSTLPFFVIFAKVPISYVPLEHLQWPSMLWGFGAFLMPPTSYARDIYPLSRGGDQLKRIPSLPSGSRVLLVGPLLY